jgi:hypothetical protein
MEIANNNHRPSSSANKRKKKKKTTEKEVGVSKRKHTPITISQKIEICIEKNKDPNIKNNQLAFKYNAGESTVSDILKKSDYFLSLNPNQFTANSYRERSTKYPEIEQSLALWIDQAASDNCTLSGHIVISKAKVFAQHFQINDFKGSNGWFDRFKRRYNISEHVRCGEANSAPLEELSQYRDNLKNLLSQWNLDDVYNCDETALYWKLEPSVN